MASEPGLRELEILLTATNSIGEDPVLNVLTSALNDTNPQWALCDISTVITTNEGLELNALDLIPLLWTHIDQGEDVKNLFNIFTQRASAKECLIGLQEILGAFISQVIVWDEDEDESPKEENQIAQQLSVLLDSFAQVIPRLKLKKKGPIDTLKPTLKSSVNALQVTTPIVRKGQVPDLFDKFLRLLSGSIIWMQSIASTETDQDECNAILITALLTSTATCGPYIDTNLAEEYLEEHFPRRYLRTAVTPKSLGQKDIMTGAVKIAKTLGLTTNALLKFSFQERQGEAAALASLLLLAHWPMGDFTPQINQLATMGICIEYTLQSNVGVNECIFLLMSRACSPGSISESELTPLIQCIASIAASSPDPIRRNSAFVTLSLLLKRVDPPARLVILGELLSLEDPFPQMRVAAIGLVKESVFDGLASKTPDVFASPQLFTHLGRYLLRPEPIDLFDNFDNTIAIDVEEFFTSVEPARLTECLGFYYALLLRDANNQTGVRDGPSIAETRCCLLDPLSRALKTWNDLSDNSDGPQSIPQMPRVALEIALERVLDTLVNLGNL